MANNRDLHTTAASPDPSGWTFTVRQTAVSLILTGVVAFVGAWWTGMLQQRDLNLRLDNIERRQDEALRQVNANTLSIQQNAIKLAEISVIQNNLADQIREIKGTQRGVRPAAAKVDRLETQWWAARAMQKEVMR